LGISLALAGFLNPTFAIAGMHLSRPSVAVKSLATQPAANTSVTGVAAFLPEPWVLCEQLYQRRSLYQFPGLAKIVQDHLSRINSQGIVDGGKKIGWVYRILLG